MINKYRFCLSNFEMGFLMQEAVAATTTIQESIFLEMGVGESVPEYLWISQ